MIESIPVRLDTSSLAEDEEFQRLFLAFADARMKLSAYLDKALYLKVVPVNDEAGE